MDLVAVVTYKEGGGCRSGKEIYSHQSTYIFYCLNIVFPQKTHVLHVQL